MEKTKRNPLIAAHLPDSMYKKVDEYCRTTGLTRADLIKLALVKFFGIQVAQ
jgi:hypothetical protein